MCYSKEISLIVSIIMFLLIIIYWKIFIKKNTKHLNNFFKFVLIGMTFIAGHQLAEFLSINFGNELIYKIGLLSSITGMIFFMISLEKLSNYDFKGNLFIPIVLILAIYIFKTPMTFKDFLFWIRGNSHHIWVLVWTGMFIYWNICSIYILEKTRTLKQKSAIKWYLWGVLDITFVLALIYFLIGSVGIQLNIFSDLPSIWCTISIIQLLFVPYMFKKIKGDYPQNNVKHRINLKVQSALIIISLIILTISWNIAPLIPKFLNKLAFK
jgi:hypothetical protein